MIHGAARPREDGPFALLVHCTDMASKTKAEKAAYDKIYNRTVKGRERVKAWRTANPEKSRASIRVCVMRQRYGLTVEEYDRISIGQNGTCAICKRPETATHDGLVKRLAIDHCHSTGQIRGFLCFRCNSAVGNMGEDAARMRAAADYIEAHHGEG